MTSVYLVYTFRNEILEEIKNAKNDDFEDVV